MPPILGGEGGGTHWAWIMGSYSDVPAGIGMWDNHRMFWPVFHRQVAGDDGDDGDDGEDSDVLAYLKRIAEAVEKIAAHFA